MQMKHVLPALFALSALPAVAAAPAPTPRLEYFRARADASLNGTVKKAERRDRQLGASELFHAMHNLLEAGRHLEKLDVLLDLAAEMQDRVPSSRTYGNYRWYFRDGCVMDCNAVDFCMQPGSVIARDLLGAFAPEQRRKFVALLDLSIVGCMNRRVRPAYTNIAIMNAVNLILLGEACRRPDAFAEGVRRLDAFTRTTALFGICEYSSPTYTGVDILNLHRLHAQVEDADVRARAERLLRLFWTDACACAFTGAGRLGGAHSRDYDYLYGMGVVARLLRAAGVAAPLPGGREEVLPFELVLSSWRPDAPTTGLADQTPRTIAARWGDAPHAYRTCWLGKNVSLGVAGASYGNMDVPLAVDFASPARQVRGYFIADGRHDPHGVRKIPEGQGPHRKTLHLKPFWGGVQRSRDALGLVVYRVDDVPAGTPTLESHFVFPSDADEILIGDEAVRPEAGRPFVRPLAAGDALFVRQGAGAFALRVPWSRNLAGDAAPMALVWDGLPDLAACRLTVAHHDFWGRGGDPGKRPGAAFWVRVADDVADASAFAAFRAAFRTARAVADAQPAKIALTAAGLDGALALEAAEPFGELVRAAPVPADDAVFVLNGRDVGAEILGSVPGVRECRAQLAQMKRELAANRILLSAIHAAGWEAEQGVVVPDFVRADDARARGGKYVWLPGEPGGRGGGSGRVSWQLEVKEAGSYTLWGRVSTATPEDDSFFVSVTGGPLAADGSGARVLMARTDWHLGQTKGRWAWVRFPVELALPAGAAVLNLHAREDGAKIDCLFLTPDPAQEP
ncbi:MAG: hypothetical protein ACI4Q3_08430 [Kiritimatiellia bacterium]